MHQSDLSSNGIASNIDVCNLIGINHVGEFIWL